MNITSQVIRFHVRSLLLHVGEYCLDARSGRQSSGFDSGMYEARGVARSAHSVRYPVRSEEGVLFVGMSPVENSRVDYRSFMLTVPLDDRPHQKASQPSAKESSAPLTAQLGA